MIGIRTGSGDETKQKGVCIKMYCIKRRTLLTGKVAEGIGGRTETVTRKRE